MWFLTSSLLMLSISNPSQAHLTSSTKSSLLYHFCHLTTTSPSDHILLELSPLLLASLWFSHVFQNKVLTVTTWQCSEHPVLLLLDSNTIHKVFCGPRAGLLSNPWPSFAISCHITSPLNVVPTLHPCSLKLITNSSNQRAFACIIPFYQNATSLFTQLSLCSANFYMAIKFQLSCPLLVDTLLKDSQSWARLFCYMLQRTMCLLLFEPEIINF